MKDELCRAFCQELQITRVPAGLAVGTAFDKGDGDRVGFYIVGPDAAGLYQLQDDGATIPVLEAAGADLSIPTRAGAFQALLDEYGVSYDEDVCELRSELLDRQDVPHAAMKFVALLIRIPDLLLLTRERAETTWIEEAKRDLLHALAGQAALETDAPVDPRLAAYPADLVVRAADRPPVALFFGSTPTKAYEALLLHSYAKYQLAIECSVVLLLEEDVALTGKIRQRADNHLIVPRYRGGEADAIGRIVEAAVGLRPTVLH